MLENIRTLNVPFRHFISLGGSLSLDIAKELISLANPSELQAADGSRADYMERTFLKKENEHLYSNQLVQFCQEIRSHKFVEFCKENFDTDLTGSKLRAEIVCDVQGFYQVPHTDVGDKRITWLTYLGDTEENGDVGTDLYNEDQTYHSAAPWGFNNALIFKPGPKTFHGFGKGKQIKGLRKVLIINFVDNWKDIHELYE